MKPKGDHGDTPGLYQAESADQDVRYGAFIARAQTLRLTVEQARAMFGLEFAWDGRFDGALKRCDERLRLLAANGYLVVLLRDVLTPEELGGQSFSAATSLNDGQWMERSACERFAAMGRDEQRAFAKSAIVIARAASLHLEDAMARLMRLVDEGWVKP